MLTLVRPNRLQAVQEVQDRQSEYVFMTAMLRLNPPPELTISRGNEQSLIIFSLATLEIEDKNHRCLTNYDPQGDFRVLVSRWLTNSVLDSEPMPSLQFLGAI